MGTSNRISTTLWLCVLAYSISALAILANAESGVLKAIVIGGWVGLVVYTLVTRRREDRRLRH